MLDTSGAGRRYGGSSVRLRRLAIVLALALALASAFPAGAQDPTPPAGEPDELKELEALLRQETELATKTRMNHDFVPGMVTVLSGDELEALGVRNVWEALSLVPGVQTVRDSYGSPLILVRGINFIFNSGNIKILVDSVPLNQEAAGINSSILLMPVEDVERIELMRGPGSAIHGDFAYLGLLNIVTRREARRLYGVVEEGSFSGGATVAWSDGQQAGSRASLGLSGFSSRDVDGTAGPSKTEETHAFGRLFWSHGGLSLSAQGLTADRDGRASGGERYLEKRLAAELRYARDLSPALHAEAYAGILRNDDEVGAKTYDGQTVQAGVDVRWSAPGRHRVLATLSYARSTVFSARLHLPPLFDTGIAGIQRRLVSAAVQDEWDLTDRLTVTAGLRLDSFDDVKSTTTGRFALVYRLGDHHVLKTQYSEGARSPWFAELYRTGVAQPGLESETIATTELSYILRYAGYVGRVTVFESRLRNMIQPFAGPGGTFANAASARTRGVEVEWTQELGPAVKVSANVSWVDPEDRRFTRDVLAASEWLGNLTLVTKPASWLRLAGRWNHVGTRGGFEGIESLPTIPGYDTVDVTASSPGLASGLTLRGGVKNVFDDEVRYITTLPPPLVPILQRYGGRTFWAELAYRF